MIAEVGDWLKSWQGRIVAFLFFAAIIVLLYGKLEAAWKANEIWEGIRTDISAIREEQSRQARADSALDYAFRDAMCRQLGVRNDECIHFPQGVRVMLVAPAGAATEVE
jgi:hypothetical protein